MILALSRPVDNPESVAAIAAELTDFVHRSAAAGTTFDRFERALFRRLLALGGAAADLFLKSQGNGDLGATVRTDAGVELHRSAAPQARKLRSIFKEHAFDAFVYARGPRQRIELRPVDARLALPGLKASHLFQEFSQLFCADTAFASAAGRFEQLFGQKVSVDVLESINRDMGAWAAEFLDEALPTPAAKGAGAVLVLTADGKGVPLVRRDAAQVPAFDKKERPGNRRMATLGCAYTVDRHARTPEQVAAALFREGQPAESSSKRPGAVGKRYRSFFAYQEAGEEAIPGAICTWTWLAGEAAQRHQAGQPVVRLMDGQPILWESADACLEEFLRGRRAAGHEVQVIDILDILHVSSYVWKAAKAFHPHREHQEAFARERLLALLRGGVRGVVKGLRRMASLRDLPADKREEVEGVCRYFENNAGRMRYHEYLDAGYPIATGVIEGACRHVIKDRMGRGGMRWTRAGAEAMLNVRAVYASDLAEEFHAWRLQEEAKEVHPHRRLAEGCAGFAG